MVALACPMGICVTGLGAVRHCASLKNDTPVAPLPVAFKVTMAVLLTGVRWPSALRDSMTRPFEQMPV